MSQASHARGQPPDIELGHTTDRLGLGHLQSVLNEPSESRQLQVEPGFGESSWPLFSMYSKMAKEEDDKTAERWQKDADGILIFTGLFSAAVAALLAVSIQDLKPNSQDTSAFYLKNIYQLLAETNISRPPTSSGVTPPPFSPPRYAVWANSLWFLSLVISLTCALLATLLHQWARRYIRLSQPPRCSPEKRARIRAFLADGVEKMHLPWVVELLTTLLHLSLFLFFSGLLIYLFNTDHTVFGTVIWWVALTVGLYAGVTLIPIFRHDSPYYTPLTSSAWLVYAGVVYKALSVLLFMSVVYADGRSGGPQSGELDRYREWSQRGVEKAAEDTALDRSLEVDVRILRWTIDALGEDDALERLFEALPGFLDPNVVPPHGFVLVHESGTIWAKLLQAMSGFLDRTLSSNSFSASVKIRRLTICLDAASHLHVESPLLSSLALGNWHDSSQSVEVGHFLRRWGKDKGERFAGDIGAIVARIVVNTRERNGQWISLAKDQFHLPDRVFDDYLSHGDSVLLAILIHVNRQAIRSDSWTPGILSSLSQFEIQNTLAGLQHDFCTLWNEIVQEAREGGAYSTPVFILKRIRRLYIVLHQGTSAVPTRFSPSTDDHDDILYQPSSYPLCNVANHRTDSTAHAPVTTSLSVPQRDPVVLAPISPPITPDIPSSQTSNRDRTTPLGDLPDTSLRIIHIDALPHPIPSASHSIPATSPDLATAGRIQGNTDISTISGTANPITRGDPPLRKVDETEIVPSSIVFHSPRTPIPMPTPSPVPIPAIHPSPLASTVTLTECVIPHTTGTPSESSTLPRGLSFSPLDSAVSHQHAAPRVGTIGAHNDTQGPNSSLMEVSRHPREAELSASDTATNS